MASLRFLLRLVVAALTLTEIYGGVNQVPLPTIDRNEWWGPGNATANPDTSIRNFTIKFDAAMVSDLKYRLQNRRPIIPPLEGINFEYGSNHDQLQVWLQYLLEQYPFQDRETFLNQYPQYKTNIQGLDIHFIRVQSQNMAQKTVIPLLLLHGWPGSVREFYETIPYLISTGETNGFALDVIVPSLPGFAFSDGAVRPGLGVDKAAVIFSNLMHRLGYSQYYIQGGDMGALVTTNMATFFPDEVLGFHTNFPLLHTYDIIFRLFLGNFHQEEIVEPELLSRIYPSGKKFFDIVRLIGYLHIQATKPDTFGVGHCDSPSGLMAHNLLTRGYPNNTGTVSPYELLDNYMVYWASNCAITAMRLYSETFNKRYVALRINEIRTPVPIWILQAPRELIYLPPWMIKDKFPNILGNTLPPTGGHFYAWENPQEFATDVVGAIVAFRQWHAWNSTNYANCSALIRN